jgi:hypothetical protein
MSDEFHESDFDDYLADEGAAPAAPLSLGPGVYDIPLVDYLADPCASPSLRSSDIQRMLRLRPAHVKAFHPRLCEPSQRAWAIRRATKRMDLGNVIHAIVLGNGAKFCVIDPSDFFSAKGEPLKGSGKEHKAAVADAKARGLIVLSRAESVTAQRAAEQLMARLDTEFRESGGWPFGEVEQTLVWTEHTEHGPVQCRARPDILAAAHGLICDVKTSAAGLADDDLARSMSAYGGEMFVQAAWQRRGLVANFPELAEQPPDVNHNHVRDEDGVCSICEKMEGRRRVAHMHAFCETEPPFETRIVRASVVALEMADRRCARAVEMFAACRATGAWPGWESTTGMPSAWLEKLWLDDEGDIET